MKPQSILSLQSSGDYHCSLINLWLHIYCFVTQLHTIRCKCICSELNLHEAMTTRRNVVSDVNVGLHSVIIAYFFLGQDWVSNVVTASSETHFRTLTLGIHVVWCVPHKKAQMQILVKWLHRRQTTQQAAATKARCGHVSHRCGQMSHRCGQLWHADCISTIAMGRRPTIVRAAILYQYR